MKKTIYLFFLFSISCNLFGQTDNLFIEETKKYVIEIDSINKLDSHNSNYVKSIADGIIERNDGVVGGYGIETLSNRARDSVYRIEYNGGIDLYTSKTYYYKSNKLVYAIFEISDFKNKQGTLYLIEEFYREKKKIYALIKVNKLTAENRNEAKVSLLDDGAEFINNELSNSR